MGRKPTILADRPLTGAEREARRRARRDAEHSRWREALERIAVARTAREARTIAAAALDGGDSDGE